jgi:hypothetical protein
MQHRGAGDGLQIDGDFDRQQCPAVFGQWLNRCCGPSCEPTLCFRASPLLCQQQQLAEFGFVTLPVFDRRFINGTNAKHVDVLAAARVVAPVGGLRLLR